MYIKRINCLLKHIKAHELDGLLITKDANIRYISGFMGSESFVIVSPNIRAFITDTRYTEQAESQCPNFQVVPWRTPYPDLPVVIKDICDKSGIKRLGFEKDVVTVGFYEKLKNGAAGVEFISTSGLVEELRYRKDETEIDCLRKACEIADKAFEKLLSFIKPGVTEKDVERELQYNIKLFGATDVGFPTIVVSGKRSSMPHGIPSDKRIEKGDFVTIDFGALYNGYRSDMTRTVIVGEPDEKQRQIYYTVLKAQKVGVDSLKSGISGKMPDQKAREIIEQAGYKEYFGHGLGHGIGLEIHEEPFMGKKCDKNLEDNIVVTVEPGIYIPEWGGVRIEDSVLIKDEGIEIFTKSSKELIVL